MPHRVLMFCPQYMPVAGGAEYQAEKLAKALVRKGILVKILTPRLTKESPFLEIVEGVTIDRFSLFDIGRHIPKIRGYGPANLISVGIQIQRAIARSISEYEILHCHLAAPQTAFAMLAAQRMGKPVLCKVGMAGDRCDVIETGRIGLGGQTLARMLTQRMNVWVATTLAVRNTLTQIGVSSERIASIPNGVELSVQRSLRGGASLGQRFLYVGRLSKDINRDVATLIRAFDRLATESLELAIVGGGDLYEETRRMVSAAKFRDKIYLPGQQPPQAWLDWADCFVLPSRREGLSNALLEAMAEGLACIANDIPPNREVLDDGRAGILVPLEDEDALYLAMKTLATIPGEAERFGRLARSRVEKAYSIDSVADRYVELYRKIIRQPS